MCIRDRIAGSGPWQVHTGKTNKLTHAAFESDLHQLGSLLRPRYVSTTRSQNQLPGMLGVLTEIGSHSQAS